MARLTGSAEIRVLLVQHLDGALARLAGGRWPESDDVHEARKQIKHARALLHLLRPALSSAGYVSARDHLRLANRPLASARDAKVVDDAFRRTLHCMGTRRDSYTDISRILRQELTAASKAIGKPRGTLAARVQLRAVRRDLATVRIRRVGWKPVGEGFQAVYRRGRKRQPTAKAMPSTEALHRWRKEVRRLQYSLEALQSSPTGEIRRLARTSARVAELLGRDHDLALLDARVRMLDDTPRTKRLLRAIALERARLQGRALKTGTSLYSNRPATVARTLRAS